MRCGKDSFLISKQPSFFFKEPYLLYLLPSSTFVPPWPLQTDVTENKTENGWKVRTTRCYHIDEWREVSRKKKMRPTEPLLLLLMSHKSVGWNKGAGGWNLYQDNTHPSMVAKRCELGSILMGGKKRGRGGLYWERGGLSSLPVVSQLPPGVGPHQQQSSSETFSWK